MIQAIEEVRRGAEQCNAVKSFLAVEELPIKLEHHTLVEIQSRGSSFGNQWTALTGVYDGQRPQILPQTHQFGVTRTKGTIAVINNPGGGRTRRFLMRRHMPDIGLDPRLQTLF